MAQNVETYGIQLIKGNRYFYRGVMFKRGQKAEVDMATRNHLVGSGHFRDINFQEPEAVPIPVRRVEADVPVERIRAEGHREVELGQTGGEGASIAGAVNVPSSEGVDV